MTKKPLLAAALIVGFALTGCTPVATPEMEEPRVLSPASSTRHEWKAEYFPDLPLDRSTLVESESLHHPDSDSWMLAFDAPFTDIVEKWIPALEREGWATDTGHVQTPGVYVLRRGEDYLSFSVEFASGIDYWVVYIASDDRHETL